MTTASTAQVKTKFANLTRNPRNGNNPIRYSGKSSNGGLWDIVGNGCWYRVKPVNDLARSVGVKCFTGQTLANVSEQLSTI